MDKDKTLNEKELNEISGGGDVSLSFDRVTAKFKQQYSSGSDYLKTHSFCKYENAYREIKNVPYTGMGYSLADYGLVECTCITCASCNKTTYWPKDHPGEYLDDANKLATPPLGCNDSVLGK